MMEALALVALSLAAVALLASFTKLDIAAMSVLGPIVGTSTYVLVTTIWVAVTGRMSVAAIVTTTTMVLLVPSLTRARNEVRRITYAALWSTIGIGAVSLFAQLTNPLRLTPDSAQYLAIADILSEPGGLDKVPGSMLITRGLGTSSLQALGSLDGLQYATATTAVLTASGVAIMVFVIAREALRSGRPAWAIGWSTLAVVFVASSNRAVYDAFYVNSHGPIMACFLAIVVAGFLSREQPGWLFAAALCGPLLVVSRPEGAVTAFLALLPVVVAAHIPPIRRLAVAAPTVVGAVVWFGVALWSRTPGGPRPGLSDPVTAGVLLGTGLMALTLVMAIPWMRRLSPVIPWAALAAMAMILGAAILTDRQLLLDAVAATSQNLVSEGLWGITWPVLGALAVGALFADAEQQDVYFTVPILGFGMLFWLLPYVRGGGYRVGEGDSGNRILAHVFLAVLTYVVLVALRDRTSPSMLVERVPEEGREELGLGQE